MHGFMSNFAGQRSSIHELCPLSFSQNDSFKVVDLKRELEETTCRMKNTIDELKKAKDLLEKEKSVLENELTELRVQQLQQESDLEEVSLERISGLGE